MGLYLFRAWRGAGIEAVEANEVSVVAGRTDLARHLGLLRLLLLALAVGVALSTASPASALAAEGELTTSGGTPLPSATGLVISPDGKHLYATAQDTLTAFVTNQGRLSVAEVETDGIGGVDGLEGATGVAISPDGDHVYVASATDDALAAFVRSPATGKLDFVEAEKDSPAVDGLDGAHWVSVSPDGKHVYVASALDDAVTVFARDAGTGEVEWVETNKDGVGAVVGLNGARGVSTSPDGKHVYVASQNDDSITAFARNPGTGRLSFLESLNDGFGADGLNGARGVAISPAGDHLYVASIGGAVAAFTRNKTSGTLDFVEAEKDNGLVGLDGARGVTVTPDGKHVYVAAFTDAAVTLLRRDPSTGELDFLESYFEGGFAGEALFSASGVATSPDGLRLYLSSAQASFGQIAVFAREADTTAPDTTIVSRPSSTVIVSSATFGFQSDDPGFTAAFECSLDGAPFSVCTSPETVGPLSASPHEFEVRAVDTAGNVDPSPARIAFNQDANVNGAVSAKKSQRQKGKKIIVKAKVTAGEDLDAEASGKVKVGKKSYKLKPLSKSVSSGKKKTLKLKPKKSKDAKKIAKALKKGKKAKAKLEVKLTDEAGNKKSEKLSVRLKR